MIAAYLHRIDPIAISIWGNLAIRWYGLSYLLGFIVAYTLIRHLARRGCAQLEPPQVMDLVFVVAVGVLAGGRIGYALFYQPDLFIGFSAQVPFWELLAINKGGMASHGGLIGILLAALWYARRHGFSFLHVIDLATFAGGPGMFFGRIANFINGELFGRSCRPDFPLAVKFPQEMGDWGPEPVLMLQDRLAPLAPPVPATDLVSWAIEQIQKGNRKVMEIVELMPELKARHPSQLYQAVLEGLMLFVVLAIVWSRPRKPGVIFGLCCCTYGVARIVGELFREPDAHIGFHTIAGRSFTRGQLLSALMVVAGIVVLAVCTRRNVKRLGGWRRSSHSGS